MIVPLVSEFVTIKANPANQAWPFDPPVTFCYATLQFMTSKPGAAVIF